MLFTDNLAGKKDAFGYLMFGARGSVTCLICELWNLLAVASGRVLLLDLKVDACVCYTHAYFTLS